MKSTHQQLYSLFGQKILTCIHSGGKDQILIIGHAIRQPAETSKRSKSWGKKESKEAITY